MLPRILGVSICILVCVDCSLLLSQLIVNVSYVPPFVNIDFLKEINLLKLYYFFIPFVKKEKSVAIYIYVIILLSLCTQPRYTFI